MKPIPVFRGTTGLNNKIDPVRLRWNNETGIQELAVAKDVDIGDSGRVSRRKGYSQVLSLADCHSIYPVGDYCAFVHDNALAVLERDYAYKNLRNVTVGAKMSYAQVQDKVYYCNGYENGFVKDRLSYSWIGEAYVGPVTTKTFSPPPVGHLLELYSGRIYIAADSTIWYTEPFAYDWVNFAENFIQFKSKLRMVQSVKDGLVVSDSKNTYFLGGTNPKELGFRVIANYPAIEGTDCKAYDIDEEQVVVWTSTEGICTCATNGKFTNLTIQKLWYPDSNVGAGFVINGKYLSILQP